MTAEAGLGRRQRLLLASGPGSEVAQSPEVRACGPGLQSRLAAVSCCGSPPKSHRKKCGGWKIKINFWFNFFIFLLARCYIILTFQKRWQSTCFKRESGRTERLQMSTYCQDEQAASFLDDLRMSFQNRDLDLIFHNESQSDPLPLGMLGPLRSICPCRKKRDLSEISKESI